MIHKVFVDLCCGLGGASEAFVRDPSWFVIRIDNNPDLAPIVDGLIVADVSDVRNTVGIIHNVMHNCGHDLGEIDKLVVWSSPPCQEFSNAYDAVAATAARNGEEFHADMTLVNASKAIIDALRPDYWYIENVRGAITPFKPVLGPWRQQVGSFFLWGHHPLVDFVDRDDRHVRKLDKRHSEMRAQLRALVPLVISQAILDSIDKQTTLADYNIN